MPLTFLAILHQLLHQGWQFDADVVECVPHGGCCMPRPFKAPKLYERKVNGNVYFTVNANRPNGQRVTVSFGPVPKEVAEVAKVYTTFGQWLKLYQSDAHRCLSYKSPWDAVDQMINPNGMLAVGELIDNYLKYAERTFKFSRDGRISPNYHRLYRALGLMDKFRPMLIKNCGPDDIAEMQQMLVDYRYPSKADHSVEASLTRYSLNQTFKEVRRMFVWGVGRRMVDPAVEMAFREVKKIKVGHPTIRDSKRRPRVTDEELNKVIAKVNPVIGAMMKVLRFTVCRPTEVTLMRPMDFRMDVPECWLYVPGSEKGEFGDHKGLESGDGEGKYRFIPITRTVQEVIKPYLDQAASADSYLFRPVDAVQKYMNERFDNRKTDLLAGNRPGTNRKDHPMIKPGEFYKSNSFFHAVKRGCKLAQVLPFSLYDLRRASITDIDAKIGDQNATRLVGHADRKTTDIYKMEPVKRMMEAAQQYEQALSKDAS